MENLNSRSEYKKKIKNKVCLRAMLIKGKLEITPENRGTEPIIYEIGQPNRTL